MSVIEFPNLWGLKFSINPVAFKVFGLPIYWYGIIIAVGFMLAVFLAMKDSKKFGIDSENIIDLVLYATPVAIIFARLYYVIFSWDQYRGNLREIINTRKGGLAIYGGIIGALLVAYIFARVKKINLFLLLDFAIPYVALAQAVGRWGNFVNQEAFGTNTTLPWGMTSERIRDYLSTLDGKNINPALPVHPTFLYESLWNIGVFLFLLWYRKKKKVEGEVLCLYMILYGIGRFFIEGLRTDSLMLGNLRISQVLSFVLVVAFGILFYLRRKKAAELGENTVIETSEYGTVLRKLMDEEDISAGPGEVSEEENKTELDGLSEPGQERDEIEAGEKAEEYKDPNPDDNGENS